MKKILLLLLLSFILSAVLFSCGGTPDNEPPADDGGEEGNQNNGGNEENLEDYLFLIENGVVDFTVTHASGVGAGVVSCANEIVSAFKDVDVSVNKISDAKALETKYEIVIGSTEKRGSQYFVDSHLNGEKGYSILVIENKIVITAGSDNALKTATKKLISEWFGITKETDSIESLKIPKSKSTVYKQDDYKVSKIDISGEDIDEYVISIDASDGNASEIATFIQTKLYTECGYWLKRVTNSDTEKQITVKFTKDAGEDGFRIRLDGKTLIFECAYINAFKEAVSEFLDVVTNSEGGSYSFPAGFSYTKHVSTVKYSDFGAVGNGAIDDFQAIKAAHAYANEGGQTVYADPGAIYYIGNTGTESIRIKTDTVWTGATFFLDDDVIGPYDDGKSTSVFVVSPDTNASAYSPGTGMPFTSLSKGQTKVDFKPGYNAMIIVKNTNHESFIRYPGYDGSGEAQQELFLIDKDGNVDPSTPICWDYNEVTYMEVRKIDDTPITILGGTVISNVRAPREHTKIDYAYYARGLLVARSNTTVKGLTHLLENEPITGSVAYGAFLSARNASNVVFEDCTLQAHIVIEDVEVRNGSYDTGAYMANNVTWLRCKQVNYAYHNETGEFLSSVYDENGKIVGTAIQAVIHTGCWGIMGSNYCKNLVYDSSILSRFDAHCGVHNAKIINSEVTMINLIGSGKFELINSTVNYNTLISLRNDYGSTWRGDIIIKDTFVNNSKDTVTLFSTTWYNHNYGYNCYMPENITIENVTYAKSATVNIFTKNLSVLEETYGNISGEYVYVDGDLVENINPYTPTKKITVINPDKNVTYYIPPVDLLKDLVYETTTVK